MFVCCNYTDLSPLYCSIYLLLCMFCSVNLKACTSVCLLSDNQTDFTTMTRHWSRHLQGTETTPFADSTHTTYVHPTLPTNGLSVAIVCLF